MEESPIPSVQRGLQVQRLEGVHGELRSFGGFPFGVLQAGSQGCRSQWRGFPPDLQRGHGEDGHDHDH